jgi:glycogen debranching enzyme
VTQPPMAGHALAELHRGGIAVPDDLVDAELAALSFLLVERDRGGLPVICHPWESGCDDSPRWDGWYPGGRRDPDVMFARKGAWVRDLRLNAAGSPVASASFEVASCAFAALVAFNVAELAEVSAVPAELVRRSERVIERLAAAWDPDRRTFVDQVVTAGAAPASAGVRTLEALLAVLVLPAGPLVDDVFDQLLDPGAFGGECGPTQVHRGEPSFEPTRYWRGPAWPQLSYLFWVAARRHGRADVALAVRDAMVRGALRSGWAEYWHPDTGEGYGAVPQSWTGLVAVVAGHAGGRAGDGGSV